MAARVQRSTGSSPPTSSSNTACNPSQSSAVARVSVAGALHVDPFPAPPPARDAAGQFPCVREPGPGTVEIAERGQGAGDARQAVDLARQLAAGPGFGRRRLESRHHGPQSAEEIQRHGRILRLLGGYALPLPVDRGDRVPGEVDAAVDHPVRPVQDPQRLAPGGLVEGDPGMLRVRRLLAVQGQQGERRPRLVCELPANARPSGASCQACVLLPAAPSAVLTSAR